MPKEAKNKEKKVKENKEKRHFLKDVKAELKKVIWPTPKQLFNNTLAVIVIVLIVGVIVFLLDVCFEKMNSFGIESLKTIVQSTQNEEENSTTENEESNSTESEADNSEENNNTENENADTNESNDNEDSESQEDSNAENTDNAE